MTRKHIAIGGFVGILFLALSLTAGAPDGRVSQIVKKEKLNTIVNKDSRSAKEAQARSVVSSRIKVVGVPGKPDGQYAPDRVMVKFKAAATAQSRENIVAAYQFQNVRKIPRVDIYRMTVPDGLSVEQTVALLESNPDVEYAHPVYRTRMFDTVPNDTFFSYYQYNLRNTGATITLSDDLSLLTTSGADIKAVSAWDKTKGLASVVIAVLDTGVDMTHTELVNKMVSTGHDFVNDDADATDDNFHGTHVAGIAAAETNNNAGIAGVAWNCKILPVKVLDADGNGYYDWMIEGIIWAVDNGAKVINMSLGGTDADAGLEAACKYAYDHGVLVVAASGNDGDGENALEYPAAYDNYVLAVGATDYNDNVASFSTHGPQVDVAAPGVYILSTAPQAYVGDGYLPYLFASGTSMACPHVTGFAALLKSVKSWLTPYQMMNVIRFTADDVNASTLPGRDDYIGYGRINMAKALLPYKLK